MSEKTIVYNGNSHHLVCRNNCFDRTCLSYSVPRFVLLQWEVGFLEMMLGLKWKKKSQICNRPGAGYLDICWSRVITWVINYCIPIPQLFRTDAWRRQKAVLFQPLFLCLLSLIFLRNRRFHLPLWTYYSRMAVTSSTPTQTPQKRFLYYPCWSISKSYRKMSTDRETWRPVNSWTSNLGRSREFLGEDQRYCVFWHRYCDFVCLNLLSRCSRRLWEKN